MLVLTRKEGEAIWIGDKIRILVVRISGDQVRLGIEADRGITILRDELRSRPETERRFGEGL